MLNNKSNIDEKSDINEKYDINEILLTRTIKDTNSRRSYSLSSSSSYSSYILINITHLINLYLNLIIILIINLI